MTVEPARFVTGSLLRHVVVMAGTGAIGLVSVFAVDLVNLFYISLLGEQPIAASIGFAGLVGFFQISIAIGMTIGVGALVSRTLGAGDKDSARRIASSSLVVMAAITAVIGVGTVAFLGPILDAAGATGATRAYAMSFLAISSPSLPLMAGGMCCSALLRSVGDARRAMNVTLFAAVTTAILDPILIFALHLGLEGAAVSTVLSRVVLVWYGWRGARAHDMLAPVSWRALPDDARRVMAVAGPAIATNLATPVGAAYLTHTIAQFGSGAVAGQAVADRISPVAFGVIYALSGAVGPILAQNLGAGLPNRVRETMRDSLLFVVVAAGLAWAILFAGQNLIVSAFSASGTTAELVRLFCTYTAGSFLFVGALFVANAAFNNLGFPLLSTLFNWGRATLGTIPLVYFGAQYGAKGALIGQALGSVIFGAAAAMTAFRMVGRLRAGPTNPPAPVPAGTGMAALASITTRPRG